MTDVSAPEREGVSPYIWMLIVAVLLGVALLILWVTVWSATPVDFTISAALAKCFEDAWVKSYPHLEGTAYTDAHVKRTHEEGGWIVRARDGTIRCFPTKPGEPRDEDDPAEAITLPSRPYYEAKDGKIYADPEGKLEIIAGYHTHPTSDSEPGTPSKLDIDESKKAGVPELIIDETGIHEFDPSETDDPDTDVDERVKNIEAPDDTAARNKAARASQG